MFYVRQLRGEQLCGRRILCQFRGRKGETEGEGEGELISVGEVEQNAKRSERSLPARKRAPQTKACFSYYITIRHGSNTSHAVAAVI